MHPIPSHFCRVSIVLGLSLAPQGDKSVTGSSRPQSVARHQFTTFASLPGKARGIMIANVTKTMAAQKRTGPSGAFGFASGLGNYRWVYLPCTSKSNQVSSVTVLVGQTHATEKRFSEVCPASEMLLKPLGITALYTLVEVEVNDGLGSPDNGDAIKISNLRVLDGSPAYPLHVADAVRDMQQCFEAYVKQQQDEIAGAMKRSALESPGNPQSTTSRQAKDRVFVTWLSDRDHLWIECRCEVTDGDYKYGKGIEVGPQSRRPLSAPKTSVMRYGTEYGVELGMVYEMSKTGELVESHTIPLTSFHRTIEPPKMAR